MKTPGTSETSMQGKRKSQYERSAKITIVSIVAVFVLLLMLLFTACSTSKNALPFAPDGKYGKYPTQRNKPVKNQYSWIERQWKGEGR